MRWEIINSIEVNFSGDISNQELTLYLIQQQAKSTHKITGADMTVDGDFQILIVYMGVVFSSVYDVLLTISWTQLTAGVQQEGRRT